MCETAGRHRNQVVLCVPMPHLYKECVDGDCQSSNATQLEYLQPHEHSEWDPASAPVQDYPLCFATALSRQILCAGHLYCCIGVMWGAAEASVALTVMPHPLHLKELGFRGQESLLQVQQSVPEQGTMRSLCFKTHPMVDTGWWLRM